MSIISARYNMLADVLTQAVNQSEESGFMERTWAFHANIRCIVRGIQGGGIRVVGSTERWVGGDYEDVEWAKMQTDYNISKRDRITNIRTVDNQGREHLVWQDTILVNGEPVAVPIEFEVLGSSPIMDPFGRHVEYDILLQRSEVTYEDQEPIVDPEAPAPVDDGSFVDGEVVWSD